MGDGSKATDISWTLHRDGRGFVPQALELF